MYEKLLVNVKNFPKLCNDGTTKLKMSGSRFPENIGQDCRLFTSCIEVSYSYFNYRCRFKA